MQIIDNPIASNNAERGHSQNNEEKLTLVLTQNRIQPKVDCSRYMVEWKCSPHQPEPRAQRNSRK